MFRIATLKRDVRISKPTSHNQEFRYISSFAAKQLTLLYWAATFTSTNAGVTTGENKLNNFLYQGIIKTYKEKIVQHRVMGFSVCTFFLMIIVSQYCLLKRQLDMFSFRVFKTERSMFNFGTKASCSFPQTNNFFFDFNKTFRQSDLLCLFCFRVPTDRISNSSPSFKSHQTGQRRD